MGSSASFNPTSWLIPLLLISIMLGLPYALLKIFYWVIEKKDLVKEKLNHSKKGYHE